MSEHTRGGHGEAWSALWQSTHDTVSQNDVYHVIDEMKLEHLSAVLPRHGAEVLEVGCGSARVSAFLAKRGYSVFGVDRSPEALVVARRNQSLLSVAGALVVGDAEALPFRDGAFGMVFSTGLLEHFVDPAPVLHEMTRVLTQGGLFWSDIVPAKFSLLRALDSIRLDSLRGRPKTFERSFRKSEIAGLLRSAGIPSPRVFSAGVFPPLWVPGLYKLRAWRRFHASMARTLRGFWSVYDGTPVADVLGFYFLCYGMKA